MYCELLQDLAATPSVLGDPRWHWLKSKDEPATLQSFSHLCHFVRAERARERGDKLTSWKWVFFFLLGLKQL